MRFPYNVRAHGGDQRGICAIQEKLKRHGTLLPLLLQPPIVHIHRNAHSVGHQKPRTVVAQLQPSACPSLDPAPGSDTKRFGRAFAVHPCLKTKRRTFMSTPFTPPNRRLMKPERSIVSCSTAPTHIRQPGRQLPRFALPPLASGVHGHQDRY